MTPLGELIEAVRRGENPERDVIVSWLTEANLHYGLGNRYEATNRMYDVLIYARTNDKERTRIRHVINWMNTEIPDTEDKDGTKL